jgi:putative transcriptional regulator
MLLDKFVVLTQYSVMERNTATAAGPGESGLYNRIAVLRAERRISRQELADAVGVNYQTIGFLERGDYGPSLKLAFQIAEFFGLPLEAVFSTKPMKALSEQVYGANRSASHSVVEQDKEQVR